MSEELRGTFSCPICGYDKPHAHSDEQTAAYHEDQIHRDDGWINAAHQDPERSGWYLCSGVQIDPEQFGKPEDFWDRNDRRSQLSWLIWVRNGASYGDIPEVLFFERTSGGWQLRNLLGDAVVSGADCRYAVHAKPKYWRELPKIRALKSKGGPGNG